MNLADYTAFERLTVSRPVIEKKKTTSRYILTTTGGTETDHELVYSFDEEVFDPSSDTDLNLASMMLAQLALNYGLFCREIVFEGLYDDSDRRFIRDMMENTSREIYVNKLLKPNPFITETFSGLQAEKLKKYTMANLIFHNSSVSGSPVFRMEALGCREGKTLYPEQRRERQPPQLRPDERAGKGCPSDLCQ